MKRSATMLDAASITWALGKDSRPRAWRELPVGVLSGWHTGGDGQEPRRCPVLFLDWCSIVPRLFLDCSSIVPRLFLDCSSIVPRLFLDCSSIGARLVLDCSPTSRIVAVAMMPERALRTGNPAGLPGKVDQGPGCLRLGENLSALLVVFLGRDLIRPVLAQQLLEPLLLGSRDRRGRALKRREGQQDLFLLCCFPGHEFRWRSRASRRYRRQRFQLLHLLLHGGARLDNVFRIRGRWRRLRGRWLGLDNGRGCRRGWRYGRCGLPRGRDRRLHFQFIHFLAQGLTCFGNG